MTNVPARLRAAILSGDTEGAFILAERHLDGADREAVQRARLAMMDPEHVAALGRDPAADIKCGVAVIKQRFNPGADQ